MLSNYTLTPGTDGNGHRGLLLRQMEFVRDKTINLVVGLSITELDFEFDELANSIGTLLLHIGAVEYFTQRNVFPNIGFVHSHAIVWAQAFGQQMSKKLIRGNGVNFYLDSIAKVRRTTIESLMGQDDGWLFETRWEGTECMYNYYYKFFHLIEDEMGHCGQIRLIKKRMYR